jgi:hypothetical protein
MLPRNHKTEPLARQSHSYVFKRRFVEMKIIKIDNIDVPLAVKDFVDACDLQVEVGTNGYQGGDTGHGSRTVLMFENCATCDLRASIVRRGEPLEAPEFLTNIGEPVDRIEIVLGGDSELARFLDSLRFAVKSLEYLIETESDPAHMGGS